MTTRVSNPLCYYLFQSLASIVNNKIPSLFGILFITNPFIKSLNHSRKLILIINPETNSILPVTGDIVSKLKVKNIKYQLIRYLRCLVLKNYKILYHVYNIFLFLNDSIIKLSLPINLHLQILDLCLRCSRDCWNQIDQHC